MSNKTIEYLLSLIYQVYYYDLRLGLGYNLDKDLSKNKKNNQLVKHKNTEQYLQLYISNNYKEYMKYS